MASLLIIEPDRVLSDTYKHILESSGYDVATAASAQAAVSAADKIRPDLVILELQLVEHSGIEFLYEFRSYADWQNIPVLIHSQVPPNEFSDNLELLKNELNIINYLYKPHTKLSKLVEVVTEQLPVVT